MRPISLTLEGFTCFKQRQTLPFEGLDLFAIWGPTGAGKTSLLDAIVFALYGKVPRLDERRNRDVISLTRDRATVLLNFSAGPKRYRVLRTARHNGAPQAKLEDADGNVLADSVRTVDRAVIALLGLSYDAFVQAVMLPQGDFARFLKSDPKSRRDILRDLLRLHVYERMREAAEAQRRDLDARRKQVEAVLEQFADATPEYLAELEACLPGAQQDVHAAHAAVDRANERLREGTALAKATAELRAHRDALKALEREAPEIKTVREQIDASDRATAVMPEIRAADDAAATAEADRTAADRAHAAVAHDYTRATAAANTLAAAARDADQATGLRQRIRALDGLRGVVTARDQVKTRLSTAEYGLKTARKQATLAEQDATRRREMLTDLERRVKDATRVLAGSAYNKALDDTARRLLAQATELQTARRVAGAAREEQRQADAALVEAGRCLTAAAEALQAAQAQRAAADAAADDAETAERAAHDRHAAAILRRLLRPGEPCPVCAHAVKAVPHPIPIPELDGLRKRLVDAKRAADKSAAADKQAAIAHATAETTVATDRDRAAAAATACAQADAAVEDLDARLTGEGGRQFDQEAGTHCEDRIVGAAARLGALRADHERLTEQLTGLSHQRELAVAAVDAKTREVDQARAQRGREEQAVAEATTELARLQGEIAAVTARPDPEVEAGELTARVDELTRVLDEAKAADTAARTALATAEGVAKTTESRAAESAKAASAAVRKAAAAAKRSRFPTVDAARAAAFEPEALAALRASVADHNLARDRAQGRITVLTCELAGREVSDDDVRGLEAAVREARAADEAAVRAAATLEGQITQTRQRSEARAQHAAAAARVDAELAVYRVLADELRNDRFQEFLLEEAFQQLARGASQRLRELTDRYSLRYREGALLVVDHDNADEERSTDTLSGGETFLASLALALQLSEQIQQASGAVLLEALFIDEGFGTLDAETLDSAATAVDALRGGGRMVGIITHLRDLADRMPCRIVVNRRPEGSTIEIQRA